MSDKLEKRSSGAIREKVQYLLAFGVVASMLMVAKFPMFVIFFFGFFAFFLFKLFSSGSRNETREIFEFYLTANELLRDDERRWYGFEINEAIARGEGVLRRMSAAPPLLHFAIGALYNKAGDHSSAVKHLGYVVEDPGADESALVYPTPELRNYVKVLRKIEREPADAPMTSAAVRALERARKLRARTILENSRSLMPAPVAMVDAVASNGDILPAPQPVIESLNDSSAHHAPAEQRQRPENSRRRPPKRGNDDPFVDRKPITEVLHEIYDRGPQ